MKKTLAVICLLAMVLSTSACTRKPESVTTTTVVDEISTEVVVTSTKATTREVVSAKTTETTTKARKSLAKPTKIDLKGQRSRLNEKEKAIYDEYLPKILEFKSFTVDFDKVNYEVETFNSVIDAIFGDYPETRLYMRCEEKFDENGKEVISKSVIYAYNWLLDDEENFNKAYMTSYIYKINMACDTIIEDMPKEISTKAKYEWLGKKICEITEYEDKSDFNNDPTTPESEKEWSYCYADGPLLYGEGVCQAYAYAYQWLCHRAGLWCITCSGDCHCWNVIMLDDGLTYHVDLTWADDAQDFERYFCLTQAEIEFDHYPYEGEWIANGK